MRGRDLLDDLLHVVELGYRGLRFAERTLLLLSGLVVTLISRVVTGSHELTLLCEQLRVGDLLTGLRIVLHVELLRVHYLLFRLVLLIMEEH